MKDKSKTANNGRLQMNLNLSQLIKFNKYIWGLIKGKLNGWGNFQIQLMGEVNDTLQLSKEWVN